MEGRSAWKPAQAQCAPFFEGLFLSTLAKRVEALGYRVTPVGRSWEIDGVSPEILTKYSRRTRVIEEAAQEQGIDDPVQKSKLREDPRGEVEVANAGGDAAGVAVSC